MSLGPVAEEIKGKTVWVSKGFRVEARTTNGLSSAG